MKTSGQGMTGAGKLVVGLVLLGLVGGGVYLLRGQLFPKASGPGRIDEKKLAQVEKVDTTNITTVQEYKFVPQEKLPPVQGVSAYKWQNKTVEFPINVWIGWLPLLAANHGAAPNEDSAFFKKYGFKVHFSLIDNPMAARTAFAQGDSQILWGTLDMMVLFAPGLMKDSRTSPRIYQQIDWSNGGDGIVAREGIGEVRDLKGKTVVFAQNSPSQYYLYNLLIRSGLQPTDIKPKYTEDAFQAAKAFVSDPKIDACVSWSPDIYKITDPTKIKGTRLLSSTKDANRVIADVWAARADFARDHPEVMEGLVSGVFDGLSFINGSPANLKTACGWLAELYKMKGSEVEEMVGDAYATNFGENCKFMLNKNNPTNFENTWQSVSYVYKTLGLIDKEIPFDQVVDFSVVQKLKNEQPARYPDQMETADTKFAPRHYEDVAEGKTPVMRESIRIQFYPNSSNLFEPSHDDTGKALPNTKYDPDIDSKLDNAKVIVGQFEAATIAITGHCDSSMKGLADYKMVKDLSEARAAAVKQALVDRYHFPPDKFVVKGMAWDLPAKADDPNNQALNRRVEIVVYPLEAAK
jgi:ABC-type nitrate/sulfonate/bicarbonate transport system substrate-binding protein/outer membrane protein OmpA-like peptidoglycan-associated protein